MIPSSSDASDTILSHQCGDTLLVFRMDPVSNLVSWEMLPTALANAVAEKRETLVDTTEVSRLPREWGPFPAGSPSSVVQWHVAGDSQPGGFSAGRSMRGSGSTQRLNFVGLQEMTPPGLWGATLEWNAGSGIRVCFDIRADHHFQPVFLCSTRIQNDGSTPLDLEMLSSFCLDGITPFDRADGAHRLRLHRILAAWSAEGRLLSQDFEDLELERSWLGAAVRSIRFGSLGSMPVREYFPFVAVEDTKSQVVWGAQIECGSSWQCEAWRMGDKVSLSGGCGDREFAHWVKRIPPGGAWTSPPARVACVHGSIDDLTQRLTNAHCPKLFTPPSPELTKPIIFNDWCTHWGQPTEEAVLKTAAVVRSWPVGYYVIDAGWYAPPGRSWNLTHGDWIPSSIAFPRGLAKTAESLRELGLIPGIWFEFETCGSDSELYHSTTAPLLRRDGYVLTSGSRRFLDFRRPETATFLASRVLPWLTPDHFGYLKLDYNESIGIGMDGSTSPGEALRNQIDAVQRFLLELKQLHPNLVLEVCSSGGHRMEPSFLRRADMVSFSDAHESLNIPIVAADVLRAARSSQSQVWAVLRADDSPRRLVYSLAAGFLGRLCLSGDVCKLEPEPIAIVSQACHFYQRVGQILFEGRWETEREVSKTHIDPKGFQVVRWIHEDRSVVVAHAFGNPPAMIGLTPDGSLLEALAVDHNEIASHGRSWTWRPPGPFSACVAHFSHSQQ